MAVDSRGDFGNYLLATCKLVVYVSSEKSTSYRNFRFRKPGPWVSVDRVESDWGLGFYSGSIKPPLVLLFYFSLVSFCFYMKFFWNFLLRFFLFLFLNSAGSFLLKELFLFASVNTGKRSP